MLIPHVPWLKCQADSVRVMSTSLFLSLLPPAKSASKPHSSSHDFCAGEKSAVCEPGVPTLGVQGARGANALHPSAIPLQGVGNLSYALQDSEGNAARLCRGWFTYAPTSTSKPAIGQTLVQVQCIVDHATLMPSLLLVSMLGKISSSQHGTLGVNSRLRSSVAGRSS